MADQEREGGCGWGCGFMLLLGGVLALTIIMPWLGLPLGLVAAVIVVVFAFFNRRNKPDDS